MEEKILEEINNLKNGMAEVIENQEKILNNPVDFEYTFKTNDRHEAKVMASIGKLCNALDELREWRRNLYKGYDTNGHFYMTEGYTENVYGEKTPVEIPEHDDYSNTVDGKPGKTKYLAVIDEEVVYDKVNDILSNNGIWEIFED